MIINADELKRRYLQRLAGVRDNAVYIGPEIVTLEISNACNIRCHFCYADHAPGNPAHFDKARFFPWKKFVQIVDDAVDLNVDQITILSTGEPTIHPSFCDMMRVLDTKKLYVRLYTNATFPTDYCEEVIKADRVIINLSAVNRQQYRELKGKDLFDRVIANIERLVALRDASRPACIIEIAYIVNTVNVHQKQEMTELALRLGVNAVDFKKMKEHAYNQEIILPEDYVEESGNDIERAHPASLNGWFYALATSDGCFSNCYKVPQMRVGDYEQWTLKQFWLSPYMMKIRLLGKYGQLEGIHRKFG